MGTDSGRNICCFGDIPGLISGADKKSSKTVQHKFDACFKRMRSRGFTENSCLKRINLKGKDIIYVYRNRME